VRDACATVAPLRTSCPEALPRGPRPELDVSIASYRHASFFTVTSGGEYYGDPTRNRPPGYFGVVAAAGDLTGAAPAAWRRGHAATVRVSDDAMRARGRPPLDFGTRRWFGVTGRLELAPERPYTPFSDDVVFRWGDGRRARAVALSAWQPLGETVATLKVMLGRVLRTAPPPPPRAARPIRGALPNGLVATRLPRWATEACAALPRVSGHCPGLIPLARAPLLQVTVAPAIRTHQGGTEDLLSIEWGGEDSSRPARNRPPGFLHLEVSAGRVGPIRAFLGHTSAPRNGVMRGRGFIGERPVAFGPRTWRGHSGVLVLGDCYGNHLCFRWREGGVRRQIDLHGWEPFTETVATLRRIVASTP
jgi:hypothetical protein